MLSTSQVRINTSAKFNLVAHLKYKSRLPAAQYKDANRQKLAWLRAVKEELRLTHNEYATLEALTFCTDTTGAGCPRLETLCNRTNHSYSTVARHLARFVKRGLLTKESPSRFNSKKGKTPPKIYTLVGFKYELSDEHVKMNDDINSYKDLNNTYMPNDVCHSTDEHHEEPKPAQCFENRAKHGAGKHIDSSKLDAGSDEAAQEAARAAKAHGLSDSDAKFAIAYLMASPGVVNKGAYLAYIYRGMASGSFNRKIYEKPDNGRDRALRMLKRTEQRNESLESVERADRSHVESELAKLKAMLNGRQ